jgi:hypothetical protein
MAQHYRKQPETEDKTGLKSVYFPGLAPGLRLLGLSLFALNL